MKKVLVLSYYFPPLGLGGSQRMTKFVKYLPQYNWEPTVITVKDILYWAKDESLLDDVKDIRIIRTGSLDPQRLLYKLKPSQNKSDISSEVKQSSLMQFLNQKVFAFFCIPDTKILWNWLAFRTIRELFKIEYFDAVISTGPPHSTHLLAMKIKKKFNIPWIADFRDDWAGGHVVHEPTFMQRYLHQKYQRSVINSADSVISVSEGIQKVFADINSSQKHYLITNGYDPDDFKDNAWKPSAKYVITYSGVISKFSDPEPFFKALNLLKRETPNLYQQLLVRFVGQDVTGNLAALAKKYDVSDSLEIVGFQQHNRAMEYIAESNALLLIATGTPQDTFIPGKTFEYLGSLKPILCISNVTDTSVLLKDYSLALISTPDEIEYIKNNLVLLLTQNLELKTTDQMFVKQFDRKSQTRYLAQILDEL